MAKELRITQIRSVSGRKYDQRQTLQALGIRRMHHTVVQKDSPAVRGMIQKIIHLVQVSEA